MATSTPAVPKLTPLNDFHFWIKLEKVDALTGAKSNLTDADGVVTGFLSTGEDYAAGPALGAPLDTVTLTYVAAKGQWLVFIDGPLLVGATLNAAFGAGQACNFITVQSGGIRRFTRCEYSASRATT